MLPSLFFGLALFILDAAAEMPPNRREFLHIPILRRHNARRRGEVDLDRFATAAQHLKGKYGCGRLALSRRLIQDIDITNQVTSPMHAHLRPRCLTHVP
jgi:tRNA A37 threonylcarbamoyladenosine biosynthesis protein TsaE